MLVQNCCRLPITMTWFERELVSHLQGFWLSSTLFVKVPLSSLFLLHFCGKIGIDNSNKGLFYRA